MDYRRWGLGRQLTFELGPQGFARRSFGVSSASSAPTRANGSSRWAMTLVQPVWWLAPRRAPLSPWTYS
jgi:hypothetical protein